jgi:hypothetical protein
MTSSDLHVRVLLSIQRSLLGHIGIAVRAIICRWTQHEINVRVIFDGEASSEDIEALLVAETEVMADFPSWVAVCFKLERSDYPASIQQKDGEVAVFRRLEP